jgi:hypothetical protein
MPQHARGAARLLLDLDYRVLHEFPLANGRRADLIGLDARGRFAIVEVKSSLADYRADRKWEGYLEFCDAFYFAVPPEFPAPVLPGNEGLIVADAFGGVIVRSGPARPLAAARRKALTVRFARTASSRLAAVTYAAVPSLRGA